MKTHIRLQAIKKIAYKNLTKLLFIFNFTRIDFYTTNKTHRGTLDENKCKSWIRTCKQLLLDRRKPSHQWLRNAYDLTYFFLHFKSVKRVRFVNFIFSNRFSRFESGKVSTSIFTRPLGCLMANPLMPSKTHDSISFHYWMVDWCTPFHTYRLKT